MERGSPLNNTVNLVSRASQLAAELLVVSVTWWYTYKSYRTLKVGVKVGQSLSSILVYNGELPPGVSLQLLIVCWTC